MESDAEIVREGLLEAVGNQIRDLNPPAAKQAFDRLIDGGYSKQDAMELIVRVLNFEMFGMLAREEVYNEERYVGLLNALPELPPDA